MVVGGIKLVAHKKIKSECEDRFARESEWVDDELELHCVPVDGISQLGVGLEVGGEGVV